MDYKEVDKILELAQKTYKWHYVRHVRVAAMVSIDDESYLVRLSLLRTAAKNPPSKVIKI